VDIDDGKGKTPIDKTDDEEFERLRKLASSYCLQAATRKEMERIARCLVASCFFFGDERWDAATERGGVWVCRGTLGSRLPLDRWEELKGFLDRGLKFVVRMEDSTEMTEKEISVGSSGDSLTQGYFRMDVCFEVVGKEMKDRKVVIELLMENWEGQWPISGFPRVIVGSKE
jgi:hypothetical protein